VCATAIPWIVLAQYPERPITIVAGYGPGSGGDLIARRLAEAAKKNLRYPILVVNRAGAGGTVAISEAVAAKPDGYTLGLGTTGTLTLQPHETTLSYGGPDTYTPIAKLVTQPHVLMVRAGARWRTAQEFFEDVRMHPGQRTVGVPGAGTVAHINVEQLKQVGKLDLKVAFFDGPKQVEAVLAGQIDACLAVPGPTMPHVKAGRGVALAVVAERRMSLAPDVPTLKDLGFNVTLETFQGIIAPRGTPESVVKALDEEISKIVAEPSFVSAAEATQSTIDYKGPATFAAELRQAFEENAKLIRALGIRKR
jgi:tripartite-type tricarboxylate transporter receptor subunit TctC